jgi:peptidyl-prolyl cis-trans isomerase SurA
MSQANVLNKGSTEETIMQKSTFLTAFSLLLTLALAAAQPAWAAIDRDVEGIAAIVNDQVISLFDVDQRVDLVFATSGLEKSNDMRERIRQQVLRSLVDEKLQMQEADRVEIEIEAEEVDKNIKRIATENKMSYEGIQEFLKENAIEEDTLKAQIRAELAWSQFVRRSFGGRLSISDEEVDEQYEKAMRSINEPRYYVSEILLNLDSFANDEQINALSNEIVTQLQNGVDFGAVARQFSIAPSSARGGQLGWLSADQLDKEIAAIIVQMQPGQISTPIRARAGIYILALGDVKQGGSKNPMKNQFDILTVGFDKQTPPATVNEFVSEFRTCRQAQRAAKELQADAQRSGLKELQQLPAFLHTLVGGLEAGRVAPPQSSDEGVQVFVVCDRKDDLGVQISRDAVSDNIYSQRLSMMARRHLRDLRREAVVEYR